MRILKPLPGTLPRPVHHIVGDWPMNSLGDRIFDRSGNQNTGTLQGAAPAWDYSMDGPAVFLPGTNEYISLANNSMPQLLPLTIIVKAKIANSGLFQRLFHSCLNGVLGTNDGFFFQTTNGAALEVGYWDGLGVAAGNRRSKIGGIVSTGWMIYAAVIRGPLDMSLFIDGIDVGGAYNGGGLGYSPGTLPGAIGALESGATKYYITGLIEYVCVFDWELFPSEIAQFYREAFYRYPENRVFAVA